MFRVVLIPRQFKTHLGVPRKKDPWGVDWGQVKLSHIKSLIMN